MVYIPILYGISWHIPCYICDYMGYILNLYGISWNIPYYIWDYMVFIPILYQISWNIPCYIWDYMGYILNLYGISWNIPCYIRIIWVRLMDFKPRIRFVGRTSCVREANPGRRMSSSMVSSQVRFAPWIVKHQWGLKFVDMEVF